MSNMSHCQVIKMTLLCHNDRVALIDAGEYALSKLLGITMQDLWEVLIACNCD
jgi:hypothetical protein